MTTTLACRGLLDSRAVSCRSSVCRNRESGLIDGHLHYSPEPLDPPPEGIALICCAAPLASSTGSFPLIYWQGDYHPFEPAIGSTGARWACWAERRGVKESEMAIREVKPDRLSAFSDGVFAVIITILVLELKPPHSPNFEALVSLWPTAVSYAVSYLFIAIVWVNHHHLLRHADIATSRLIWANFAHLFSVSLMPFSTAWIAQTDLAAVPVSLYAGVFVLVNATYLLLCMEVIDRPQSKDVPPRARMMMRVRSLVTLGIFASAAVVALKYPTGGMALICLCLVVYLRPEAPEIKSRRSRSDMDGSGPSPTGLAGPIT
jgi:TMEM175 potassium channel family protein